MSRSSYFGELGVMGGRARAVTTYRMCDLALASNIVFDELAPDTTGTPDLTFGFERRATPALRSSTGLYRSKLRKGGSWLEVAALGGEYLIRIPGLAEFVVSSDGRSIQGYGSERVPLRSIRRLLLDQVLPVVLSQQAALVLHATAIATPRGAVAFIGAGGTGKSTLTGSLATGGWPLLTDDFLVLRGDLDTLHAVPSYPGLRLWSDSAAELFGSGKATEPIAHLASKRRCGVGRNPLPFAPAAVPLARIYVLAERGIPVPETVSIDALSARVSFAELGKHCYRLDVVDRERLGRQFDSLAGLATRPIFRRLTFPLSYACLPDVRRAILADLDPRAR